MKTFCGLMMIASAVIGVGVLDDCGGDCIQPDHDALWRWMVAFVCMIATVFFGLAAVTIGGLEDE